MIHARRSSCVKLQTVYKARISTQFFRSSRDPAQLPCCPGTPVVKYVFILMLPCVRSSNCWCCLFCRGEKYICKRYSNLLRIKRNLEMLCTLWLFKAYTKYLPLLRTLGLHGCTKVGLFPYIRSEAFRWVCSIAVIKYYVRGYPTARLFLYLCSESSD